MILCLNDALEDIHLIIDHWLGMLLRERRHLLLCRATCHPTRGESWRYMLRNSLFLKWEGCRGLHDSETLEVGPGVVLEQEGPRKPLNHWMTEWEEFEVTRQHTPPT
jgi:hypothetical protein